MRAILLTIVGAAMLTASFLAISLAMTPQECDALAGWVYAQAEVRDTKELTRQEHKAAALASNEGRHGPDVLALLMRELAKVYDEGKTPIAAAMDSRYECYKRRGEVGVPM